MNLYSCLSIYLSTIHEDLRVLEVCEWGIDDNVQKFLVLLQAEPWSYHLGR